MMSLGLSCVLGGGLGRTKDWYPFSWLLGPEGEGEGE